MKQPSETAQFVGSLSDDYIKQSLSQLQSAAATTHLTTLSMVPTPTQLGVISSPGNSNGGKAPTITSPPPVAVPIQNSGNKTIAAISPIAKTAPIAGGVKPPAPIATVAPVGTARKSQPVSVLSNPSQRTAPAPAPVASGVKLGGGNAPKVAVSGLSLPSAAAPSAVLSPSASLPTLTASLPSHNAGGGFQPVKYASRPDTTPEHINVTE